MTPNPKTFNAGTNKAGIDKASTGTPKLDSSDFAMEHLLLAESAQLPEPGGNIGPCLTQDEITALATGRPLPGRWSHTARCASCRKQVLEARQHRSALERVAAWLRTLLGLEAGGFGWRLAPLAMVAVALLVLKLGPWSPQAPDYMPVAPLLSAEVELASNGLLAAPTEPASDVAPHQQQLEQARRSLRMVYPGGIVAFRFVAGERSGDGQPPEVFVVLTPENGTQRRILQAQTLRQERSLTLIVKDGQIWPTGTPLRVAVGLGTSPDQAANARSEALELVLPDALSLGTSGQSQKEAFSSFSSPGQIQGQVGTPVPLLREAKQLVSMPNTTSDARDKGKSLACTSCETGKQVPPQDRVKTESIAANATRAQEREPLHSPLPIRCVELKTAGWWICDLPMRLMVQE